MNPPSKTNLYMSTNDYVNLSAFKETSKVEYEDFGGVRKRRTPKKSSGKGKSGGAGAVHTEVGAPGARGPAGPAGPPVSQPEWIMRKN